MKKLSKAQITTKAVEISKSLINTQIGLHNYDLNVTQKIGDAARFSVAIRRSGIIDSEKLIAAMSTALKIDYRIIKSEILPLFKELDWLDIVYDNKRISRIDERIPPIEDVLSELGKQWEEDNPTKIDRGSINSLAEVSMKPTEKSALLSELDINENEFQVIKDYGTQAKYLGTFNSEESGKEIIWSPLFWNKEINSVLKYLQRQTENKFHSLETLANNIIKYPGRPREQISNKNQQIINAGIYHGFFSEVNIQDRKGENYQYIFPPSSHFELEPNKDIFEKARMIIGCIRHGEYHAEISKIRYPLSILKAMRNNTMRPHSYAIIQYALLKLHGIIDIKPLETTYVKKYKVCWKDSPENNIAAEIARQLLRGEEVQPVDQFEVDAKKILIEGVYNYTSEQRRIKSSIRIVAKRQFDRLMEYTQGVKL